MNFKQAVSSCFSKYVDFSGRARRSEFWYWTLFVIVVQAVLEMLDSAAFPDLVWGPFSSIFTLATVLPGLAVMVRRLHDLDRTGWWVLLMFVPIVGWIIRSRPARRRLRRQPAGG
jgi:uncharacterized membrane protein YhaH (DUF805 family)